MILLATTVPHMQCSAEKSRTQGLPKIFPFLSRFFACHLELATVCPVFQLVYVNAICLNSVNCGFHAPNDADSWRFSRWPAQVSPRRNRWLPSLGQITLEPVWSQIAHLSTCKWRDMSNSDGFTKFYPASLPIVSIRKRMPITRPSQG
jgi:hypothetical protein